MGPFSARYCDGGFIFDTKGSACFLDDKKRLQYFMAFVNSTICRRLLSVLAPTLDYNSGVVSKLPIVYSEQHSDHIQGLVAKCIIGAKEDWDSFETSWDFQVHPLIRHKPERLCRHEVLMNDGTVCEELSRGGTLAQAFDGWQVECWRRFHQLKANEEELNRIFIDIYGLRDELIPVVEDKDVTVRRADLDRDIRSLISYAVGCMFGRYSLDVPGLAYAGGAWDAGKYRTYLPDDDNCLPITDEDYGLKDDVVNRFVDFIGAAGRNCRRR